MEDSVDKEALPSISSRSYGGNLEIDSYKENTYFLTSFLVSGVLISGPVELTFKVSESASSICQIGRVRVQAKADCEF